MTFDEYFQAEMRKENDVDFYDPAGNSARAVAQRGLVKEIVKQYGCLPSRSKRLLRDYNGLETPIGWVLAVPLFILFFPVLPILWGCISHKRAIDEYRSVYLHMHNNN